MARTEAAARFSIRMKFVDGTRESSQSARTMRSFRTNIQILRSHLCWLAIALAGVISLTTGVASARAQTFFLDRTASFSQLNDKAYDNFTVSGGNVTYDFRFVSDYNAIAAIIKNSDIQAFYNGSSVSTYYLFNHTFGVHTVTLAPGSYSVVMRSDVSSANTARYELDKPIDFSSNSTFYDNYIQGTTYVKANGGYMTQAFTINDGYRYWIDGCNTGLAVYVIPASELSNFTNNRTFTYYVDYSSAAPSVDLPGGVELLLNPGDYYLVARNPSTVDKPIQYNSSRWKLTSGSGGGNGGGTTTGGGGFDLSGKVVWKLKPGGIKIKAAKVANNNTSGISGSLRLQVWATKSRYAGGTINGYVIGSRALDPLSANSYYPNVKGKVPYTAPPTGTYYTTMTLEEYGSSGWSIRDYENFPSTSNF